MIVEMTNVKLTALESDAIACRRMTAAERLGICKLSASTIDEIVYPRPKAVIGIWTLHRAYDGRNRPDMVPVLSSTICSWLSTTELRYLTSLNLHRRNCTSWSSSRQQVADRAPKDIPIPMRIYAALETGIPNAFYAD